MQGTERQRKRRFLALVVVVVLLFSAILLQLMQLQIRDGESYYETAQNRKMKTYTLKGNRGMILDRNGIPLAYDQESFDVEFYRDPARRSKEELHKLSQILLSIVGIVEKNGGKTVNNLSLKRNEAGEFYFDFLTEVEKTFAAREKLWRENFYVRDVALEEIYPTLCERYGLNGMSDEDQIKVLALWQELQMNAFLSKPIKIAYNVNMNTVAELEAAAIDLTGVSIANSSVRVYPRGTLAAHVIGYTGAITEEERKNFTDKGYAVDDQVGVSGIEKSMEEQLTGCIEYRQGLREVEVDANGSVTRELSYKPALDGNNVVLTLDIEMQQILEQSLADTIQIVREEQLKRLAEADEKKLLEYQAQIENRDGKKLQLAASGGAAVMNVHTGEMLAMASYPSFDPNDFIRGMTTEEYDQKYNIDTSPLFNRVISSKATPGSVFKMVTALAGLQESVVGPYDTFNSMTAADPYEKKGKFIKYDTTDNKQFSPGCWAVHTSYRHQDMNVKAAITNSCNYYFYNVADRLGIEKINKWASLLGLTSTTGIELGNETTSVVGMQSVLYDPSRGPTSQRSEKTNYVARTIIKTLNETAAALDRTFEQGKIEQVTKMLMDIVLEYDESSMLDPIREVLIRELGLSADEIRSRTLVSVLNSYLREIHWTPTETIMTGIGQSITEVTPIALARYTSAIANGGTVLEAQVVDKVLSTDGAAVLEKQPVVVNQLEGVSDSLKLIRQGMKGVISLEDGGTASKYYEHYKYKDEMAVKTGTAQVNLIDLEDSAWCVAFAPFDDPEIAIVVLITNGLAGGLASVACQGVVTNFNERMNSEQVDRAGTPDTFVP